MKQQLFEEKQKNSWDYFAQQLKTLEDKSAAKNNETTGQVSVTVTLDSFARNYRKICYDLALAKERHYSPNLVDRLNDLALRGHQQLYQNRTTGLMHRFLDFVLFGFPLAVRKEWKMVTLGLALFYVPAITFGLLIFFNPSLAFSFFSPEQVNQFSEMYNPAMHQDMREARGSSEDLYMFGFYIRNNIGIGFQTFASGILFGVGTLFYLIYNGLAIGGVAGYLTHLGFIETFYSFVVSHGAFELTAIGIAGAAGMKLGFALLMPGKLSRKHALLESAKTGIPLVYGVILFLFIAAFIEAFWSPATSIPNQVKYWVGGSFWVLVTLYFVFAGRGRDEP
ncbi:MAG: stage II sporulation protein M [Pseudomonadales bacterium]|nr:stage II sporulation protein M [Pseudomonadales bacterium]